MKESPRFSGFLLRPKAFACALSFFAIVANTYILSSYKFSHWAVDIEAADGVGSFDTGPVLSGKLFTGEKVREFPSWQRIYKNYRQRRKGGVNSSERRPSWAHRRPCSKWSVMTTIFDVSEATRVQAKLPDDWCMVIVGDQKGSDTHELDEGREGRIIYLNVEAQEAIAQAGIKLAQVLPWNSFGRKNLGYLYAIASGAKLIWDFDDDNMLLNSPPSIMEPSNDGESVVVEARPNSSTHCLSFNPMNIMGAPTSPSWPRGLPLLDIKSTFCQPDSYTYATVKIPTESIAVYQSMANRDPDVDAIYRLTQPLPFDFSTSKAHSGQHPLLVPPTSFAPFNAQATLFTYPAFFMLLLPISVHGRVADIWRSFFGQRLLRDMGFHVVFTPAQVVQHRNAHNYLADFESEQDLYMKSGKLVEYLLKWNSDDPHLDSLVSMFEQMFIGLYEHNYLEIEDVRLAQTWLETLIQIGYNFSSSSSLPRTIPSPSLLANPSPKTFDECHGEWPELELFAPIFPGGENELMAYLIRSLSFFWPKEKLNLLLLIDDEIENRDEFADRMREKIAPVTKSLRIAFNSISRDLYYGGHDRQQLIMLWADNFTSSEYVGFIDDDTFFTNNVIRDDLFDDQGRPHVFAFSRLPKNNRGFFERARRGTEWAYGGEKQVMHTMSHFPVIIKTAHLKEIRDAIMNAHLKEYSCFDHLFWQIQLRRQNRSYSQFNLMHHFLWRHKRAEYNWHFQPVKQEDATHVSTLEGVTSEMIYPKPRCSLHVNYDVRKKKNKMFVDDIMKRGFCYSLTKEQYETGNEYGVLCKSAPYSYETTNLTENIDNWLFDFQDWRWHSQLLEAHQKRHAMNCLRNNWDPVELKKLFG